MEEGEVEVWRQKPPLPRRAANAKQRKEFLLKGWDQRDHEHPAPASPHSNGVWEAASGKAPEKAEAGTCWEAASLDKNWGM